MKWIIQKLRFWLEHPKYLIRDLKSLFLTPRDTVNRLRVSLSLPIVVHGIKVLAHLENHPVVKNQLVTGCYEHREWSLLKNLLTRHDNILELGGGIGVISCAMARIANHGRVTVFEPNPEVAARCAQHIEINRLSNVSIKQGVLGKETDRVPFFIPESFMEGSQIPSTGARKVEVEVFEAAGIMEELIPNVLVMDIEGGEYDLLALPEFYVPSLDVMVIEFHAVENLEGKMRMIDRAFNEFKASMTSADILHVLSEQKATVVGFQRKC